MFSMFAIITVALITACFLEAVFVGRKRLKLATSESSNDDLKKALHGNVITAILHYGFIASLLPLVIYAIKESANFELMLVIAALSGMVLAIIDKFFFKEHRTAVQLYVTERKNDDYLEYAQHESGIMEWGKSFFPILILVICLRGFLLEPFQIPSGSMLPTLRVGDFLVVNKFTYGLKLPVIGTEVVDFNDPEKGDVVVFKNWRKTNKERLLNIESSRSNGYETWIKRIIAGPGDTFKIDYENRLIYINGEQLGKTILSENIEYDVQVGNGNVPIALFQEEINGVTHSIYNHLTKITSDSRAVFKSGQTYTVPEGKYFVMGDNRDGSEDGRFINYIDEDNIVGKATYVWMHLENKKPSFNRNGSIE